MNDYLKNKQKILSFISDDAALNEYLKTDQTKDLIELFRISWHMAEGKKFVEKMFSKAKTEEEVLYYAGLAKENALVFETLKNYAKKNPTLYAATLERVWSSSNLHSRYQGAILSSLYAGKKEELLKVGANPIKRAAAFAAIVENWEQDNYKEKIDAVLELYSTSGIEPRAIILRKLFENLDNPEVLNVILSDIGLNPLFDGTIDFHLNSIKEPAIQVKVITAILQKSNLTHLDNIIYQTKQILEKDYALGFQIVLELVQNRDYFEYMDSILEEAGKKATETEFKKFLDAIELNKYRTIGYWRKNLIAEFIRGNLKLEISYLKELLSNSDPKAKKFCIQIIEEISEDYYKKKKPVQPLIQILEEQTKADKIKTKPTKQFQTEFEYLEHLNQKYKAGNASWNLVEKNISKYPKIELYLKKDLERAFRQERGQENLIALLLTVLEKNPNLHYELNQINFSLGLLTSQDPIKQVKKGLLDNEATESTLAELRIMTLFRSQGISYVIQKEKPGQPNPDATINSNQTITLDVVSPKMDKDLHFGGTVSLSPFNGMDAITRKIHQANSTTGPFLVLLEASHCEIDSHTIENGFNGQEIWKIQTEPHRRVSIEQDETKVVDAKEIEKITGAIIVRTRTQQNEIAFSTNLILQDKAEHKLTEESVTALRKLSEVRIKIP